MTRSVRSRRAVLVALVGGAALAGSVGCDLLGSDKPRAAAVPHALAPMLSGALSLVDTYTATIAAQPTLVAALTPLLEEHRAHVAALREAMGATAPSGSPSVATPASGLAVAGDPAAALAAVRSAEQAAQGRAVKDCLAAPPRYASLLGSIAASRACHLEVLA